MRFQAGSQKCLQPITANLTFIFAPFSRIHTIPFSDCGIAFDDILSSITNLNDGNQFPIIPRCTKVENANKTKWRFTCDVNENGIEDENDTFETAFIKRGDFSNVKGRFTI